MERSEPGSRPGRIRRALLVLSVGLMIACEAPPELRPDPLLVDSLGLSARDRVHRVEVTRPHGVERVAPAAIEVLEGDRVSFRTGDGFVHLLRFELDSLGTEREAWARDAGLDASPPLLARGARWVLSFEGAMPGRYPFVADGDGAQARGVVVVSPRR